MGKTVVVYHSGYGHTQRLAQAVADGANGTLLAIDADGNLPDGGWELLAAAQAIVFGSPTYMGSVSWQFKKFADASSRAWMPQTWKDKVFGGFTNSANMNGDKFSTLHYFITLAMQHGGLWAGTAILYNNTKSANRSDVNYLGSSSGVMGQTPGDVGADGMNAGDLETARLYGARIAAVAARLSPA